MRKTELSPIPNPRRNPIFKVKGIAVVSWPLEIASVVNEHFGARAGLFAEEGDAIVAVPGGLLARAPGVDPRGAPAAKFGRPLNLAILPVAIARTRWIPHVLLPVIRHRVPQWLEIVRTWW